VLVALATMPNVPLDDQLLAAVSIGAPIGLGIYYAWVNRDWTARTRATGFAVAVAGALAGAWLGFNVVDGLFAVVTTILGATVGANLTLLVLDIVWDRRARDRFAAADAREALAPQASIG
jgi:hypothetical protein